MSDSTFSSLTLVSEPLTLEALERATALLRAEVPQVCCVACRREGSWLEIEGHWETVACADGARIYRLARCLVPDIQFRAPKLELRWW